MPTRQPRTNTIIETPFPAAARFFNCTTHGSTLTGVRLTIVLIVLTALGLVVALAREGHGGASDMGMLAVAVGCVCLFGSAPVLMGVLARRKAKGSQTTTVIPRPPPPAEIDPTDIE